MVLRKISFSHLLLVFFVAVLLRVPSFIVPYYNIDEITNVLYARFIIDGEMHLIDFLGQPQPFTVYLYTLIAQIFGHLSLLPVHLFHALWVGTTSVILYFAGMELTQTRKGAFSAAFFYAVFSICFFSKDFQAANAESLSLLPASLAAFCYLRGVNQEKKLLLFLAGFFVGIASYFKTPAGIMIFPIVLTLLLAEFRKKFILSLIGILGLGVAILFPFFFTGDFSNNILSTVKGFIGPATYYIQSYGDLEFSYWFTKYLIRTILVLSASLPLWYFTFLAIRTFLFNRSTINSKSILDVFFLITWFISAWLVVTLGRRVFFHYFVFLFPPLCLLAAFAVQEFSVQWKNFIRFGFGKQAYGFLSLIGLLSLLAFFGDGIFRWSLKQKEMPDSIRFIKEHSTPSDRIYIWGLVPQLYFFSDRKPASTMIWADALAGFSPGSPAMEYMRSTGATLTLPQSVVKDLRPFNPVENNQINPLTIKNRVGFTEQELFSFQEIIDHIQFPPWKIFFQDVLKNPPKLILDTSPTGIRGFSSFPVENHDLLSNFIRKNYDYLATIDKIIFYQLKHKI